MQYLIPINRISGNTRILFPESDDIRILVAAIALKTMGIVEPVLIGNHDEMVVTFTNTKKRLQYSLGEIQDNDIAILDSIEKIPLDLESRNELASEYVKRKGGNQDDALSLFPGNIAQAAKILKNGIVEGVVAGSIADTKDVIRVGYNSLGLAPGRRISGEFLMIPSEKSIRTESYIIGDSAVNPDPTAEQIVDIAASLIETHLTFFPNVPPRVAFLSFSTYQSGIGDSVDKIKKASELFFATYPNIESDGPLQIDAAIDTDVYLQKTKGKGRLTAPANILVFPSLDAGNMFYKNMERFGGYSAIGPILTGFRFPAWSDLSRGTSIQSIIDMAYVTALRSQGD